MQEPEGVVNPFHSAMDKLGDGLVRLGEGVSSAGGHLGGLFVGLGNKLRGTMYACIVCLHTCPSHLFCMCKCTDCMHPYV